MKYYKKIDGDRIASIGVVKRGGNITKAEYDRLLNIIHNRPEAPDGYYYVLLVDETWQLIKNEEEE